MQQFNSYEGKNDAPEGKIGSIIAFFRKPTTFIIIVLVCLITVLSLQFGAMQAQLSHLTKQMKAEEHKEAGLSNRLNGLSSQVHSVQRDERDLKKKEADLEKKESNLEHQANENPFGELTGMHEIQMSPLMPHVPDMFNQMQMPHMEIIPLGGGPDFGMMSRMNHISDMIKNKLHSIHKTGPAAEHHMGPLIPIHNILTPGAHPKHLNTAKQEDEKKEDKPVTKEEAVKKEEPKKDDKKADEKDQV